MGPILEDEVSLRDLSVEPRAQPLARRHTGGPGRRGTWGLETAGSSRLLSWHHQDCRGQWGL